MVALRFVALDFDGTLTDFPAADRAALEVVRRRLAPNAASDAFLETAVEEIMAFHVRAAAGLEDPLQMHHVRLERLVRRFPGARAPSPGDVVAYTEALVRHSSPMDSVGKVLETLAGQGFRLAIVSNAYDATEQRARIDRCLPGIAFDAVVIGSECAAPKPSRAPFDRLLELLDEPASAGVYVGDVPRFDVPGALEVGLRTIIVSARPNVRTEAVELGALACTTVLEVLDLL